MHNITDVFHSFKNEHVSCDMIHRWAYVLVDDPA